MFINVLLSICTSSLAQGDSSSSNTGRAAPPLTAKIRQQQHFPLRSVLQLVFTFNRPPANPEDQALHTPPGRPQHKSTAQHLSAQPLHTHEQVVREEGPSQQPNLPLMHQQPVLFPKLYPSVKTYSLLSHWGRSKFGSAYPCIHPKTYI